MPTVRNPGQVPTSSAKTGSEIEKTLRPAMPRDDIDNAFAGDENAGPFSNEKETSEHSTNVKSRKTEKSKHRTPIR